MTSFATNDHHQNFSSQTTFWWFFRWTWQRWFASCGRGSNKRLGIQSMVFVWCAWPSWVGESCYSTTAAGKGVIPMDVSLFVQLLSMVGPYLCVDEKMLKVSTMKGNIVTAEITLHCLLWWLAGGLYIDIHLSAGISCSSFYCCTHSAMNATSTFNHGRFQSFPFLQMKMHNLCLPMT